MPQHRVNGSFYDHAIVTGSYKPRYSWEDDYCIIQINTNQDSIAMVYNMVSFKLKVMYVEDDTLNIFLIRHNNNVYLMVETIVGDVQPNRGGRGGTN